MNSHTDGGSYAAPSRFRALLWPGGPFIVSAACFLFLGQWFDALFFVILGLFVLFGAEIERLPKPARYLLTAALTVMAVIKFVGLVSYLAARQ